MTEYRIKKVTNDINVRYYPQRKVLWWWSNLISASPCNGDGGYGTLEGAQKALCNYLKEPFPSVEYLKFDPAKDCK